MTPFIKNTLVTGVIMAVLAAAATLILFVTDAVNKDQMIEILTTVGTVIVVIVVAVIVVGLLKKS